jgi:transposase InsO family protein
MDERHHTPSGPTIKKLCERAYQLFGEGEYQRLATISISHLYNLRKSQGYRRQRRVVEKTRPTRAPIGERRQPRPGGHPGFLRIDTVHQGDWDKQKGVYHLNAVDEVTQFQVVYTVEKISEAYLIPALEELLAAFPFTIHSFHSDNGSEYINRRVAALLSKLLIAFTKSRARQTNDNALVEGKNGAGSPKTLWPCAHSSTLGVTDQCLQSGAPHPVPQLPPALLLSRNPDRSEGQGPQGVPV